MTLLTGICLTVFWFIFSGKTDAFHLALGAISILIVGLWTGDMLFDSKKSIQRHIKEFFSLLKFIGWLLGQIVIANLQVLYLAFHPRMEDMLNPQIKRFKCKFKSEYAQFILANSITLTPGTVTIQIEKGEFIVHAITDEAAKALPGEMGEKVAAIFGEPKP